MTKKAELLMTDKADLTMTFNSVMASEAWPSQGADRHVAALLAMTDHTGLPMTEKAGLTMTEKAGLTMTEKAGLAMTEKPGLAMTFNSVMASEAWPSLALHPSPLIPSLRPTS